MVTVGLLYPGHSAEDDFPALEARIDGAVRLPVVITSVGEDAHRVDALLDLGSDERLAEGAARLADEKPDAVMWACTSGSFVFGREGARDQVSAVATAAGVPASSTSIAFVDALRHLGIRRVAVAASYPDDVAQHFVALPDRRWRRGRRDGEPRDLHRRRGRHARNPTRWSRWSLRPTTATPKRCSSRTPRCTQLAIVDKLEAAVGKPVLTANQVTVWKGLELLGPAPPLPGLGALFGDRA